MKTPTAIGLAFLAAATCRADNIVINGGFEDPVIGAPWAQRPPGTTFGSWTVDTFGYGVAQVGSFGQPAAIEGVQFVELNMMMTGGIWQAITTQPGKPYILSFLMAGQLDQGPDTKQMQVDFDGVTVGTPEWSRSATGGNWVRHTYIVAGSTDSSVLHLLGIVPAYSDGGPYVDDVRVSLCLDLLQGPDPTSVCAGGDVSFSVKADGDAAAGEVRYQWQYQPRSEPDEWIDLEDGKLGGWLGTVAGAKASTLTIQRVLPYATGQLRCLVGNDCTTATTNEASLSVNSADFNNDGDVGTDADIEAFFACIAGDCCATCGSADFNADGDTATDADIESFFRVLAGGAC